MEVQLLIIIQIQKLLSFRIDGFALKNGIKIKIYVKFASINFREYQIIGYNILGIQTSCVFQAEYTGLLVMNGEELFLSIILFL